MLAGGAGLLERAAGDLRRALSEENDQPDAAGGPDAIVGAARRSGGAGQKYLRHWLPSDQRSARLAIYNSDDELRFEESGRRDAARIFPYLSPRSTVLDFGCGSGRVARYVAPRCAQLWAVDVSPRMLQLTRERLRETANLRFARCYDVAIPDVPSASVDVVYSFLVLQHLEREDAFLALRELRRVLRVDGIAILTFPNLLADIYLEGFVHYALSGEVTNQARARVYTPQEVERVLPAAGLSVVDVEAANEIVATCRPVR
jgi:ubiquinone/menaquinone biosynthesis C-methylase UbiE